MGLLGVDVYVDPFLAEGLRTYASGNVDALVLRWDLPDALKRERIGEFLEADLAPIVRLNEAAAKPYAALYRAFKERGVPEGYVDRMAATRFHRHFFT